MSHDNKSGLSKLPPIHMAKVYLHQAQATQWRHWKIWLLDTAGKYRRRQLEIWRTKNATKIELTRIDKNGQWRLF